MQYGNVFSSAEIKEKKKVFKSYYVVWKPCGFHFGFETGLRFKSYYVVWKLFSCVRPALTLACLNRTMQYGNTHPTQKKRKNIQGLNRTMQYGNSHEATEKEKIDVGLNRTMQYGNIKIIRVFLLQNKFKSYYVVWKRKCRAQKYSFERRFKSYYVVWKQLPFDGVFRVDVGLNRTMQYGNLCQRIEDLPGIEV